MKPSVAVVGGGWAGCATALTLAEAGVNVTLFEASRTLGGRARSATLDGRHLDNGQHLLLGAYRTSLALIARVQPPSSVDALWRLPLRLETPPDFQLSSTRLPAPFNLLTGLLGAKGLGWHEKWITMRWVHTLLNRASAIDDTTVAQLTHTQPERARRLLWYPLCIAALNTPPEIASARTFIDVLRAAFGGTRSDSDFVLPRTDLSALFPLPAATRIRELGGQVVLGQRVHAIETARDSITLRLSGETASFTHVVIASAPQHLAALTEYVRELDGARRMTLTYCYFPIATGYVQVDPGFQLAQPLIALRDGPAQYVFDRGHSHGQPGMLAFVASAARPLPAHWLDLAEAQLQRVASPGNPHWRRAIVEKQATYACVPGLPRPTVHTPHPRLYLAGDYTAGPYPATLESAMSSGVQSAHALLNSL